MNIFFVKTIRQILILLLLAGCSLNATASHMAGADISYTYTGNNNYLLTYTLYSDCSGSIPPASLNATLRSASCSINRSFVVTKVTGSEMVISANCTSAPSVCNGGIANGYRQIKYTGTVAVPQQCSDYIFSVTDCCRNPAITTISNPGSQPLYVEAFLNNLHSENSSPVFTGAPIILLSTNQYNQISSNGTDPDGDSLVYSLISPKTSELTQVTYLRGFDSAHFVTASTSLLPDSKSGMMNINPSQQETGIVAIRISEWKNGELTGTTMRDIQMITLNSANTIPTLQQLEGAGTDQYSLCDGEDLAIPLSSVDPDASQNTTIEITSDISGLSVERSNDRLQKAMIRWKAVNTTSAVTDRWIKIVVSDNACPMNASKTYFLQIHVSTLTVAATIIHPDCSSKNNGSIHLNISGTGSQYTTMWLNDNSHDDFITGLSAGNYQAVITDGNACTISTTFHLSDKTKMTAMLSTEKATCNTSDGSAIIEVTGGNEPYSFQWKDNSTSPIRSDLAAGNYTLHVTDQKGCVMTTELKIESQPCANDPGNFVLYPNPATASITIENTSLSTPVLSIVLSDVSGKIIYSDQSGVENSLKQKIDISNLSAGIYFVKIICENSVFSQPFVKN